MYRQKNKSVGVKSGDLGGQRIGPFVASDILSTYLWPINVASWNTHLFTVQYASVGKLALSFQIMLLKISSGMDREPTIDLTAAFEKAKLHFNSIAYAFNIRKIPVFHRKATTGTERRK